MGITYQPTDRNANDKKKRVLVFVFYGTLKSVGGSRPLAARAPIECLRATAFL